MSRCPRRTGAEAKYKTQLEPLYQRLTQAIRAVDKRHAITPEGADWANDWSIFTKPFDSNVFYQFHFYCWERPTKLNSISRYLEGRERLQAPIWCGETGEKDNAIYWATTDYFEAHNIGWSFWPWKKMDARNAPYSIKGPPGWDSITAYSRNRGNKPAREEARRIFDRLLQNIRLDRCQYFPDVVNAIFRRVPGKVEAENYGHEGPGKSYLVGNESRKSRFYRTSEPVLVEPLEASGSRGGSEQCVKLDAGEWTAYALTSLEPASYHLTVRVKAAKAPAAFQVLVNDQPQQASAAQEGWTELRLKEVLLLKGVNHIRLLVRQGTLTVDWLDFENITAR